MVKLFSVACILLLSASCHSTHYTPKTYKSIQLTVGTSGGVTGTIKEYTLFDNGQFFTNQGITGEIKEHPKIDRGETHRIFKKAGELGIGTLKFSHPGNITYYMILKQPSRSNVIKWGEAGVAPPEGIKEFYGYLLSVFQP